MHLFRSSKTLALFVTPFTLEVLVFQYNCHAKFFIALKPTPYVMGFSFSIQLLQEMIGEHFYKERFAQTLQKNYT